MHEQDLFGSHPGSAGQHTFSRVPGLVYAADFVTSDEAARIIAHIDEAAWSEELRRRVQHYGFKYDYKVRSINESMRAAPLPQWAVSLGNRLVKRGLFEVAPDQVIVNEYLPGQGIASHVDCVPCFGGAVASVSFLSSCVMSFTQLAGAGSVDVDLEPGSVVLLTGEARFDWKHGISARLQDKIGGIARPRSRRVSATFRTVVLKQDRQPARRNAQHRRDTASEWVQPIVGTGAAPNL